VVATAVAIIVLPIEQGVAIGIVLSLLQGVWSVTRSRVIDYERVPGTTVLSAPQTPRLLVIEASGILEVDFTAAQVLIDLIKTCHRDGIIVAVARLESLRAQQAFARFHIKEALGPDHVFLSVDQAVRALPHLGIPK
jgi:SulP family sulfate permease